MESPVNANVTAYFSAVEVGNVKLTIPYESLINKYRYYLSEYIIEEELDDSLDEIEQ